MALVRFAGQKWAFTDLMFAFTECEFSALARLASIAPDKEDLMSDLSTAKPYKGLGMEGAVAHAIELAKLGNYQISGLDISETFVGIARANAAKAGVQVDFRHGNASHMPFANESFDFLLCRAAFKNFSEPQRALEEMHRVLKLAGQALIIDLRKDAPQKSINQAINDMNLGTVNGILTKLTFRFMLLKRAYTKSEFEYMISKTKFSDIKIQEDLMGFEILLSRGRDTA
jgi:ubiquinone/menaquinone biosynthesis C-methylase UbiE